ncbi:MAG: GH92 family glycosyl hydrolase, partial [Candidatus Cryptobacteroides sp.]
MMFDTIIRRLVAVYAAIIICVISVAGSEKKTPVDYVNPLIGTAILNQGGIAPFAGTPFAMTSFIPQTRENKMSSMAYVYDDREIIGFMASHQPTVWMGDYGYVSVMPQIGKLRVLPEDRKMPFDHENELATPYYYAVEMGEETRIKAEMSATSRCAIMRFTFPEIEARMIVHGINLNKNLSDWCNDYETRLKTCRGWVKIDKEKNEIIGYNPDRQSSQLGPALNNFKGYFVITFDTPIKEYGLWDNGEIYSSQTELEGTRMGAYAEFNLNSRRQLNVKVSTSFISIEQARANLENEIPHWSLEKVKEQTKTLWNEKLSKITPGAGVSEEDKITFWSSLWHCYLFPREFSEYGRYYSAFDDEIHNGFSYNDFSLWDTFRAYHPLMTMIEPELTGHWITSLLQMYKEGGWMPMWPNPSYTNIMIGTHADAVIADAYIKGIRNYDLDLAYEAMRKDAMVPPDCDTKRTYGDRHKWTSFEARAGASYYHSIGYIPFDKTAE